MFALTGLAWPLENIPFTLEPADVAAHLIFPLTFETNPGDAIQHTDYFFNEQAKRIEKSFGLPFLNGQVRDDPFYYSVPADWLPPNGFHLTDHFPGSAAERCHGE